VAFWEHTCGVQSPVPLWGVTVLHTYLRTLGLLNTGHHTFPWDGRHDAAADTADTNKGGLLCKERAVAADHTALCGFPSSKSSDSNALQLMHGLGLFNCSGLHLL
jgi:hypothetical protein